MIGPEHLYRYVIREVQSRHARSIDPGLPLPQVLLLGPKKLSQNKISIILIENNKIYLRTNFFFALKLTCPS